MQLTMDAWEGALSEIMKRESPRVRAAAKPAERERVVLPPYAPGMRIGLFGGTFDPPHAAHRAACLLALRRLGLDRVWWLVTPGNPLKNTRGLAPLAELKPPAWVFLHGLKSPLSSTALRAARSTQHR
jgi:hypothetical protein